MNPEPIRQDINARFRESIDSRNAIISSSTFPAQNAFTRDIRTAAAKQLKSKFLSLWAETGVSTIREDSAANLIQSWIKCLEEKNY